MVNTPVPQHITARMYQVGFGDCFLVSFHYAAALGDGRAVRHMLIDFGSTHTAQGSELTMIADLIQKTVDGKLDVLVVSHRHRDHIGAFANDDVMQTMRDLQPSLLIRPWTENPHLRDPDGRDRRAQRRYVNVLDHAQKFADKVEAALPSEGHNASLDGVRNVAQASVTSNQCAITRLDDWARNRKTKALYLSAGNPVPLEDYIPGVSCDVLGPPRIEQWPDIVRQRYNDADEFWLASRQLTADAPAAPVATSNPGEWYKLTGPSGLGPARWLLNRLVAHHRDNLVDLVDEVDGALNNTSLVLLFTAGAGRRRRRLLFPGDAQIENWEFVFKQLSDREGNRGLDDIDLVKIGHHGSRNATPKSLVALWDKSHSCKRMVALMSTKADVHGRNGPHPVPKPTLVDALEARMPVFRTDTLPPGRHVVAVQAAVDSRRRRFEEVNDA